MLLEQYETVFGIYNHQAVDPSRPMASVAMHPAENTSEGGLLDERLQQFVDKKVSHYFGLSLKEFLDYPPDMCMKILEICAHKQKEDNTMANNVLSQLDVKG